MENTNIRLVVNPEHAKISKLLGTQALSYLFDKFCIIFTESLRKYFKVISVHHRYEIKQRQYVFTCTVLSNQNSSKGRHKIYKTKPLCEDKYVITKGELQNEFDKQFADNIIYNKMHFTIVHIESNFNGIPSDIINNSLCDAIDSYYNISFRNKVFTNKAILESEKIAIIIKDPKNLECLVISNKTYELITHVCGDNIWLQSNKNKKIIDVRYVEMYSESQSTEEEANNASELLLYYNFYSKYFTKSKMVLLPEYIKISNSTNSEIKYIKLEDLSNYVINPNECIRLMYPNSRISQGYHKKKAILFYDFYHTYIIKECQICMDQFYRECNYYNSIEDKQCHIKSCPSCFNEYVNSEIDTYLTRKPSKFSSICPVSDCKRRIFHIENNTLYIINKFYKYLSKSTISRLKLLQSDILLTNNTDNADNADNADNDVPAIRTREEAELYMKELIDSDISENAINPTLSKNINICPNVECNTIIIRSYGCNAVICSKCSTKLCIACGVFDVSTNRCNCNQSITTNYFERSQLRDVADYNGLFQMEPIII